MATKLNPDLIKIIATFSDIILMMDFSVEKQLENISQNRMIKIHNKFFNLINRPEEVVIEKVEVAKHVRGYAIEPDDIVFGNKEASVKLVEYFSPTCPHCVSYHKRTFPEIEKKYINRRKYLYD